MILILLLRRYLLSDTNYHDFNNHRSVNYLHSQNQIVLKVNNPLIISESEELKFYYFDLLIHYLFLHKTINL